MSRFSAYAACLLMLPAIEIAHAQQACENPAPVSLADPFAPGILADENSEVVQFQAGSIEASLLPQPSAIMTGGVIVRRGNRLAGADSAEYDPETLSLHLEGGVRYQDPNTEIVSDRADFKYESGEIRFEGAEFLLGASSSRGAADVLMISQQGTLDLGNVNYTTCPPDSNDWLLEAGSIELDTNTGVGTARKVKLRFQGVPVIYAPYLSFPLSNARKSGVLTPTIGSAGRSGNELEIPYYWNIRENYDATISPRWLSNRGLQVGTEFRYLTERNEGMAVVEVLANDSLLDQRRSLVSVDHQTLFNNGWRNVIDYREVSDSQYFEDLGGTLSLTSITHLNRNVRFDYFNDHWAFFGQVQDFQTLDDTILPEDQPYRRLPQVRARGLYPDQWLGLALGFDGEVVSFDRDTGVTGWRANALPSIELPLERAGWFVRPAVAWDYTRYSLTNTQPGQPEEQSRSLPISSFDTGMIFERTIGRSGDRIQTIEPRLLYVYVPFRDQSSIPVFDTITPDLNLVQLYRKNRFLGVDRIGDTNQFSIGITSRIFNSNNGEELLTATIGQARYLSDQLVSLPDSPAFENDTSDYIAELGVLLYESWNFDIGHQWGAGDRGTTRSEARLQYRPQSNKILNLAYRFRRDSLEQGDVSFSWPITSKWNVVGRYNYSLRDKEPLEEFVGFEYGSCCWGLRMVYRRYLSTRDGTRDTSYGLQLVLKGMTSLGTAADKMLERGILGYSPELD